MADTPLQRLLRAFKRPPRPSPTPRPDPNRIAVLEHDLLGIQPEPGTAAARAVALSKPVDQTACPHDNVIETTGMGEARSTGLCGRCGTALVATDTGEWESP